MGERFRGRRRLVVVCSRAYRSILVTALVCAILTGVEAAGAANKYAGEFLTHGVGARPLGMGSAFVAVADDVTAGYWNPAGAVDADGRALQLMHSETFGDVVNYDTAAFLLPVGSDAAVAVTAVRLGIDDIPFTDFVEDTNGRIIYDETRINWESDSESALLVTYARRPSDDFRIGGNLKLVRKAIASNTCYGFGFDLGAKYDLWRGATVGANIQDVTGTVLVWDTKMQERIMPTVKLGVAHRFSMPSMDGELTLAADADFRFEDRQLADEYHAGRVSADTHYGLEFTYHDMVGVRGGLAMGQLTAGAGVTLGGFSVDYAFGKHEYFDSSHRVSASYAF